MAIENHDSSLEILLFHIISEYTQVSNVPSGRVIGKVIREDDMDVLPLRGFAQYERGCPVNLMEFSKSAAEHGITKSHEAMQWYSRSRLRYSCATLVAGFLRFGIPELNARGITELYSTTLGSTVVLSELVSYSVRFIPDKRHAFQLLPPLRREVVELQFGTPLHCDHSVLLCQQTGVVVDLSLGQFTGEMKPNVFASLSDFRKHLPGRVIDHFRYEKQAIDEQVARDQDIAKCCRGIGAPADLDCTLFAKRWVNAWMQGKYFCRACCGVAGANQKLLKCNRCKNVQMTIILS